MELGLNIKRGKVWGNTRCLFCKNNVEIHRVEIKKDGYCSTHRHKAKFNMFYVEQGRIKVTIFRPDAGQTIEDVTLLGEGESTFVEPGLDHVFEALENTVAFEIYWVELEQSDIERKNVGGTRGRSIVGDAQDS